MSNLVKITDDNYQEMVSNDKPVLIDFWAEWCGPCKMIAPLLEELAGNFDEKVVIGQMNVDENNKIPMQHGIRSIPTLLFFKNGDVVDKQIGVVGKSVLEDKINQLL